MKSLARPITQHRCVLKMDQGWNESCQKTIRGPKYKNMFRSLILYWTELVSLVSFFGWLLLVSAPINMHCINSIAYIMTFLEKVVTVELRSNYWKHFFVLDRKSNTIFPTCGITLILDRRSSNPISAIFIPSIEILPQAASMIRNKASVMV